MSFRHREARRRGDSRPWQPQGDLVAGLALALLTSLFLCLVAYETV